MVNARSTGLGLLVLLAACGDPGDPAGPAPTTAVPGIETAVATTDRIRDVVHAAGMVTPEGVVPEARDARNDLAAAEARLRLATQQVARLRALAPTEVSPRKDLEAAVAAEADAPPPPQLARHALAALRRAGQAPAH